MNPPSESRDSIACRTIGDEDRDAVVALLCRGFASSTSAFWSDALATLRARDVPPGCPRYGYCLTANDGIVGVLLLIYSESDEPDAGVRCNVSSWYVQPDYRLYAPTLVKVALRKLDCTYINTSSESHTRQGLLAQGYTCYAEGQVLSLPALGRRRAGVTIRRVLSRADAVGGVYGRLLADHAEHRCICLTCTAGDRTAPFVFLRRWMPGIGLPYAQLIFCEDIASFVALHADIGRYLLKLGLGIVMFDANGPARGIVGRYFHGRMPKYFLGGRPPRLGNLSYTEDVLFSHGRR